jgi:peptidoglycan/LPS O-acetylase OafA/YrhL
MPPASNTVASGRLVSLDGLRGIAVLTIVAFHAEVPGMTRGGYLTLDIFFVLSGFLITGVLLGERDRRGRVNLKRFYYRRVLRLYPALLAMILLLMPVGGLLAVGEDYGRWLRDAAMAVTYTIDLPTYWGWDTGGGLSHTWSLAIEEQFYLLWAPILVLMARRRLPGVRAAGGVLAVAIALWVFVILVHRDGINSGVVYARPDLRFAEVLLGCAMSIALTALPRPLPARIERAIPWIGNAAGLGLVLLVLTIPQPFSIRTMTLLAIMPFAAIFSAGVILRLSHRDDGVMAWVLKRRFLVFVGDISYGVYLWHLPLLVFLRHYIDGVWLRFAAVLGATLLTAYLSRRLVENPFLRLKDRLRTTGVAGIDAAPPQQLVEQPDDTPPTVAPVAPERVTVS